MPPCPHCRKPVLTAKRARARGAQDETAAGCNHPPPLSALAPIAGQGRPGPGPPASCGAGTLHGVLYTGYFTRGTLHGDPALDGHRHLRHHLSCGARARACTLSQRGACLLQDAARGSPQVAALKPRSEVWRQRSRLLAT